MGPEDTTATTVTTGNFSDKIPPNFDGRADQDFYHQDVQLWTNLTSLSKSKCGAALIGRLSGEAKASARTLTIADICTDKGVDLLLTHLDKSFATDPANRLDADLAAFLDFTWKKTMSVEQYIAGFHSRLDRISSLKMDDKLKGHLLLRQAMLDTHEKNMILGAASGNHDVNRLTSALRNAYIDSTPSNTNMNTHTHERHNSSEYAPSSHQGFAAITTPANSQTRHPNHAKHQKRFTSTQIQTASTNAPDTKPVFFSYKTNSGINGITGAIIDSGACSSIVGKSTLDHALQKLNIDNLPNGPATRSHHRFGDYTDEHRTICSVNMPFKCTSSMNTKDIV